MNQSRNVLFWPEKGSGAGREGRADGLRAEGLAGLRGELRQLHPLRCQEGLEPGEHQLQDQPQLAEVRYEVEVAFKSDFLQEKFSFFQSPRYQKIF